MYQPFISSMKYIYFSVYFVQIPAQIWLRKKEDGHTGMFTPPYKPRYLSYISNYFLFLYGFQIMIIINIFRICAEYIPDTRIIIDENNNDIVIDISLVPKGRWKLV